MAQRVSSPSEWKRSSRGVDGGFLARREEPDDLAYRHVSALELRAENQLPTPLHIRGCEAESTIVRKRDLD